ncbi:hypothetical protein C8Q77DRAFT_1119399 [Trametes polyzona]|nr:hypothetical protein C8Q77DRAFT_1119399 [Trametes polyzona]
MYKLLLFGSLSIRESCGDRWRHNISKQLPLSKQMGRSRSPDLTPVEFVVLWRLLSLSGPAGLSQTSLAV